MAERLKDKIVLITGAGNGIGRETAVLFAREGALLVLTDISEDGLRETTKLVEGAGGKAVTQVADVSKSVDWQSTANLAKETYGRLDVLVNNAGIGGVAARLTDIHEDDWDKVLNVNLKGVWLGMKYCIPLMRAQGGSIVNLASVAGIIGTPKLGPYGASKAGVIQLSKTAALEWARYGIRVNAVCPSWTKTSMVDSFTSSTQNPNATENSLRDAIPLGRLGQPAEISNLILFLASDESSFITGVTLPADGGLSAQ